jgi:large-conductance mechanosensitive channel
MKLVLSIVFSIILAFVLFWFDPFIANIMAFGIIGGCIFRGLYLLNDIHRRISSITPNQNKVQEAYQKYLKEQDKEI